MYQLLFEGLKLLIYVLIFVGVIFGAKYTTEFIAKRNQGLMMSRQLKLIERVPLSKDKEIVLLEYEDKRYLLCLSSQTSFVIDEYNVKKEEIKENEA